MVHAAAHFGCFETRHPQDFVRPVKDNPPLPFTRTEPEDVEIEVDIIDAVTDAPHNQIPSGTFEPIDP